MKLSDFNLNVIKDKEFLSLGTNKQSKKDILVYIDSQKALDECGNNVSCIITTKELSLNVLDKYGVAISNNPKESFYQIHDKLYADGFYNRDIKGSIGKDCDIHKTAIIEDNVIIGNRCKIGANVVILENTIIGDDVIIRPGVVIGTQGFSFNNFKGKVVPVTHAGGVKIGDRVEIQANSCISKGIFGEDTILGDDCKLDNLVHIAHSVVMGKRCFFAANAMIAGIVEMGDDVWVGPCACVSSRIRIGNNAEISLGAVVTRDVKDNQKVSGNFAIDHSKFIGFIKDISQ